MRYRLLLVIPFFAFIFLGSCKKAIEDKKKDIVLDIITSGTWYVEEFREGSADITNQFMGFNFKFTRDGVVTATLNNIIETGTWSGDVSNLTITSNFPNSNDPIKKLNGVFKIKDSSTETVVAESTDKNPVNSLRLRKNQ